MRAEYENRERDRAEEHSRKLREAEEETLGLKSQVVSLGEEVSSGARRQRNLVLELKKSLRSSRILAAQRGELQERIARGTAELEEQIAGREELGRQLGEENRRLRSDLQALREELAARQLQVEALEADRESKIKLLSGRYEEVLAQVREESEARVHERERAIADLGSELSSQRALVEGLERRLALAEE